MDATFLAGHSVGIAWLANWQIDFEGCTEQEEEEEEVDEVGTVSGISNYWRLQATPNQPPANSHLTLILNKTA